MPAMPQLETPNIAGMYEGLGKTVQGGFAHLADAVRKYGEYKTEQEIRQDAAKDLENKIGEGAGKEWLKVTHSMDLKDATKVAGGAITYTDHVKQLKADNPDFNPIAGKDVISLVAQHPDNVKEYLDIVTKQATSQQSKATVGKQQQAVQDVGQGLQAGGFEKPTESTQKGVAAAGGFKPGEAAVGFSGDPNAPTPGANKISEAESIGRGTAAMPSSTIKGEVTREAANKALTQAADVNDLKPNTAKQFEEGYRTEKDINKETLDTKKFGLAQSRLASDKRTQELGLALKAIISNQNDVTARQTILEKANADEEEGRGLLAAAEELDKKKDAKLKASADEKRGKGQAMLDRSEYLKKAFTYGTPSGETLQEIANSLVSGVEKKYGVKSVSGKEKKSSGSSDKFTVGKQYVSNGIVKTYKGNGQWE